MPPLQTSVLEPPGWFPLRWQLARTLPPGLHGRSPLPWWCGAWYQGEQRQQLLRARRSGLAVVDHDTLAALVAALSAACLAGETQPSLLVPIPTSSDNTNPMPARLAEMLAEALDWPLQPELLQRSCHRRPQRGLGRAQRWRNQWLSFRALLNVNPDQQQPPVLLVDDVFTSGATALAAQRALQSAGWQVTGIACLARTPRQGQGRA